ncbi:hypothetical protein [Psittacicella gerlachiana]|uniref:DUF3829 domain-containing protein n=1 Tax=Psittacicella gerlachiana TaxID=2028574 RepID=A0A3A1YAN5_9GAMM|nr:hypothetical protein [Psittacicella gerlachiana]RIY34735.1 hypothetical protein CKF59_04940 [Psittacicella gerlachiana]
MFKFTKVMATLALAGITASAFAATDYSKNNFIGNYDANQAVANYILGQSYRLPLPGIAAYDQVTYALFDLANDDDFHSVEDKAEHFEEAFVTFYVISKVYADKLTTVDLPFNPAQVTFKDYLQSLVAACNAGQLKVNNSAVTQDVGSSLTSKENRRVNSLARDYDNLCTLAKQYIRLYDVPEFQTYLKLFNEYSEYVYQEFKRQNAAYNLPLTHKSIDSDHLQEPAQAKFKYDNPRGYRLMKNFDDYALENRAIYRALNSY